MVLRTAQVFKALRDGLDELGAYYAELRPPIRSNSEAYSATPFIGPHLRELNYGNTSMKLRYSSRISYEKDKAVFKAHAVTDDRTVDQDVAVKFTSKYCREAHELLADHDPPFAPKLLFCEKMADVGGLWVVVMDYVESHAAAADPSTAATEKVKMKAEVGKAIQVLHDAGFVFGDLRDPNIIQASSEKMFLVDFDWAGREGEARYPATINMTDIVWGEGTVRCGLVKKEHDLFMLDRLFVE